MSQERIDRSPRGFAARNGISIAQTYIELRSGRLKAKKMGKRTIILAQSEEVWLDSLPDAIVDENGRFGSPLILNQLVGMKAKVHS